MSGSRSSLLEYLGSRLNWAPRMRAARAEVGDNSAALAILFFALQCYMRIDSPLSACSAEVSRFALQPARRTPFRLPLAWRLCWPPIIPIRCFAALPSLKLILLLHCLLESCGDRSRDRTQRLLEPRLGSGDRGAIVGPEVLLQLFERAWRTRSRASGLAETDRRLRSR